MVRAAPAASKLCAFAAWSGSCVSTNCGSPDSSAVSMVPAPPWCTTASQVGSSTCNGTDSATRTPAGSSGSSGRCAAVIARTTSAPRSAASFAQPRSSGSGRNPSSPISRAVEVPQVRQMRGRSGSRHTQSGTVDRPLYAT